MKYILGVIFLILLVIGAIIGAISWFFETY